MNDNLKLIKRVTKHNLKKDFDTIYDTIKETAVNEFNYNGEIRIISSKTWVSFYIINNIERDIEDVS